MMTAMTTQPPSYGPWVERWLSPPRFAVYRSATAGDDARALALYEWNAALSAALLRDLGHVEVGLRNAYDRALTDWWPDSGHWTADPQRVFAPLWRRRDGRMVDVNERPRESLVRARRDAGGPAVPPGKVVAELMFGFWRYLSTSAHEKTLWVPCLHRAFASGTDRRDVDRIVRLLNDLRNRVAHHEPLFGTDVADRHGDCIVLATLLDPDLGAYLRSTSMVGPALLTRP